jgi:ribosomal protein S18 acetylase RimI-like enzyme
MPNGNETGFKPCRFLNDAYFTQIHSTFIEAFSDYALPFAQTEQQLRNHLKLNAVDLMRSAGYVDNDSLIGFSLTGFGYWEGRLTAYDVGTGVVPHRRREGISRRMFELMIPVFKRDGVEQFLLEVITSNAPAVGLYKHLGFETTRELALLECDEKAAVDVKEPADIFIGTMADPPDWRLLSTFWDGDPSWQNSIDAIGRSQKVKRILGAYSGGRCVGYIVFSSVFGRVAQIAVDRAFRRRGIATALMLAMQSVMAEGYSMQVINIDKTITSAMSFFAARGFLERVTQYEMTKKLI